MRKIYNILKTFLINLGYINNPIAYIEDSMKKIEKIQHPSIFFININTKIRGNSITIEDRVDFYQSSINGHRYLLYTINTKKNDKILFKLKIKDNRLDMSYDKLSKSNYKKEYGISSGVFTVGGDIDLYDEHVNKKLVKLLILTLYKVNKYIDNKLDKDKK